MKFKDNTGREITSFAHVAGLGVPDPKPLDIVNILYRPSNPDIVRGPTDRKTQGLALCVVIVGLGMFFASRAMAKAD